MELNDNNNEQATVISGVARGNKERIEVKILPEGKKRKANQHPTWSWVQEGEEVDHPEKKWIVCKEVKCSQPFFAAASCTSVVIQRHFESFHKMRMQEKGINEINNWKVNQHSTSTPPFAKKKKVKGIPPLPLFRYDPKGEKSRRITKRLAGVLALPHLSINVLTSSEVREFVEELDPKFELPSSFNGLKSILIERYKEAMIAVRKFVAVSVHDRMPSITADVWTEKGMIHSYIGLTMHTITGDVQTSIFLGLSEIMGKHTAAKIREEIKRMLADFEIELDKVFRFVTDNGSNFVAAFGGKTTKSFMLDWDEEDDDQIWDGIAGLNFQADDQLVYMTADFPKRVPCFDHRLSTGLMNAIELLSDVPEFRKMAKLIRSIKKSPASVQQLYLLTGKHLLSPSSTRWGFWIKVIERFLDMWDPAIRQLAEEKEVVIDEGEVQTLRALHKLLLPYWDILIGLQAEKTVTISRCHPYLALLQAHLLSSKTHGLQEVQSIAEKLEAEIDRCFQHVLNAESLDFDPLFLVAALLDPNTHKLLQNDEIIRAQRYLEIMLRANEQEKGAEELRVETRVEVLPAQDKNFMNLLSQLEAANHPQVQIRPPSTHARIVDCCSYISTAKCSIASPISPLTFWQTLDRTEWNSIADLALQLFTVPATSAPIERVFSQASMVTGGRRNKTGFTLLSAKLFVYLNKTLI